MQRVWRVEDILGRFKGCVKQGNSRTKSWKANVEVRTINLSPPAPTILSLQHTQTVQSQKKNKGGRGGGVCPHKPGLCLMRLRRHSGYHTPSGWHIALIFSPYENVQRTLTGPFRKKNMADEQELLKTTVFAPNCLKFEWHLYAADRLTFPPIKDFSSNVFLQSQKCHCKPSSSGPGTSPGIFPSCGQRAAWPIHRGAEKILQYILEDQIKCWNGWTDFWWGFFSLIGTSDAFMDAK